MPEMKTLTVGSDTFKIVDSESVRFTKQTLTEEQKAQARENIGAAAAATIEPAEEDIPKVFINGTIPTTKDEVRAEMQYISKTESFDAYLLIKCQGSSSMDYDKKNFTVKMYSDEARGTKLKKAFKDWGHKSHKYVLKANWIDHSHARNIVSARIWDEVVSSRSDYDTLPEELRNSPRNGAADGFPIKLYTNGTYQGIYTWNIGKDDWMWGMDEDNANHVLLCGEVNNNGEELDTAANFRALWEGDRTWDWEVEVGEKNDAVIASLNTLISCVKDTDDDTFKASIGNYLDVQSAIDYWIHQYIICGLDGLGKNLLLATYDGTKWICGAYDMDSTFGLYWNGNSFVSAQFRCPEDYQETRSLLWERISTLYADEVRARYLELRKTVYTYANLFTHFERFMDVIGPDLYAEDLTIHTDIPSGSTNNIRQIREFIRDRLAYVDSKINVEYYYKLANAVSLNGIDEYIDTGVQLFDTEKDFTLYIDFTWLNEDQNTAAWSTLFHGSVDDTLRFSYIPEEKYPNVRVNGFSPIWGNYAYDHEMSNLRAVVFVFTNGVFSHGAYRKADGTTNTIAIDGNAVYTQGTYTLIIGAKHLSWSSKKSDFAKFTINDCRIYKNAMTSDEAVALVAG